MIEMGPNFFALRSILEQVRFIPGIDGEIEAVAGRDAMIELIDLKLLPESESELPFMVCLAGGTNTGKSSLINWILNDRVSAVSALARGTRSPVICGSESSLRAIQNVWSGFRVSGLTDISQCLDEQQEPTLLLRSFQGNLFNDGVIIDSPDFDSTHNKNRDWARRLLIAADAVILVVTPEKYNDAAVIDYLSEMRALTRTIAAVFNKKESDTAWDDFKQSIWGTDQQDSLYHIERVPCMTTPNPINIGMIRHCLTDWSLQSREIKTRTFIGTMDRLNVYGRRLGQRLNEEEKWISELHGYVNASLQKTLHWYHRELKKTRFIEIDVIFQRLLDQYKIWLLDDIYGAVRRTSSMVFRKMGALIRRNPAMNRSAREKQRDAEKIRIQNAWEMLHSELLQLPGNVPDVLQGSADRWVLKWHNLFAKPDFDGFMVNMDTRVDQWIEQETGRIASKVKQNPNIQRFLVTCKAAVQLGFGCLGAYLTGGFSLYDVALAPILERLAAHLLEMGLGEGYFIKRRSDLLALRMERLSVFFESNALEVVRGDLPKETGELNRRFFEYIAQIPCSSEKQR